MFTESVDISCQPARWLAQRAAPAAARGLILGVLCLAACGSDAFSVSSLDVAFDEVKSLGLEVVSEPAMTRHGFRSFFLRGPESVLLEYVQAGPITPL